MIYLIEDIQSKAYKIGYTESNPYGRLSACQTGNPNPLRIVSIIKGTPKIESQIHKYFRYYHKRGEWFEMHPEILNKFRSRPQLTEEELDNVNYNKNRRKPLGPASSKNFKNKTDILSLVKGQLKSELVKEYTQLYKVSKPTVYSLLNELIQEGKVIEEKISDRKSNIKLK